MKEFGCCPGGMHCWEVVLHLMSKVLDESHYEKEPDYWIDQSGRR
jgi:hypothetical protein